MNSGKKTGNGGTEVRAAIWAGGLGLIEAGVHL